MIGGVCMMMVQQLLKQARNGDIDALEMLLERYKPLMLSLSYVNGKFDEDLYQDYQEIFVQIAKNKKLL